MFITNRIRKCQFFNGIAAALLTLSAGNITAAKELVAGPPSIAYRVVPGFPQLPSGWQFGAVSAVATDSQGNVIVFHRGDHPIIVFDRNGKFLRSFGQGLFTSPHGLRVDREDNIWVTDNANHTVIKFTPGGDILMSLGEKDVVGENEHLFNRPADIAFAPNGGFYIADGYGNSRIVKFDKTGKFLLAWGKRGVGEGEFNVPHAIRLDSKNNVYVADRENKRVQVFDANGNFLRQMTGMSPFGLYTTADDILFLADGLANKIYKSTLDWKVLATWGSLGSGAGQFDLPHALTVSAKGEVYITEIKGQRIQKFVLK